MWWNKSFVNSFSLAWCFLPFSRINVYFPSPTSLFVLNHRTPIPNSEREKVDLMDIDIACRLLPLTPIFFFLFVFYQFRSLLHSTPSHIFFILEINEKFIRRCRLRIRWGEQRKLIHHIIINVEALSKWRKIHESLALANNISANHSSYLLWTIHRNEMFFRFERETKVPVGESSEESNRDELPIEWAQSMKDLRWEFVDFLPQISL